MADLPKTGRHLFTLSPINGVVSLSVALSFPLPGLRVKERLALWSSDFPPITLFCKDGWATTCSASAITITYYYIILLIDFERGKFENNDPGHCSSK
jgi:hypothetical protein